VKGKAISQAKPVQRALPLRWRSAPERASPRRKARRPTTVCSSTACWRCGAPADTDTVPSKVSARNAASDKLPTVAFVLKSLTDAQRREIVQALGGKRDLALSSADVADTFVVGSEVPSRVALLALAPVPEALAAKFPELRGTGFMRAGGSLVLVDLDNSLVIGVLDR
jgi:hypothetical protein